MALELYFELEQLVFSLSPQQLLGPYPALSPPSDLLGGLYPLYYKDSLFSYGLASDSGKIFQH